MRCILRCAADSGQSWTVARISILHQGEARDVLDTRDAGLVWAVWPGAVDNAVVNGAFLPMRVLHAPASGIPDSSGDIRKLRQRIAPVRRRRWRALGSIVGMRAVRLQRGVLEVATLCSMMLLNRPR